MDKIRMGIVGSGGIARSRARAFSDLPGCELSAIAARNPDTGGELAAAHGVPLVRDWRELLEREDVDAVAVCTNNDSHGSIALAALAAEKHVLLEYPLARNVEEGERLAELAETSPTVLRLAHEEFRSARHRALRQAASSLGDLLAAVFVRLTPGRGARPEVLFDLKVTGPPSLFFVYHIHPLVDLFGPGVWVEGSADYVGLTPAGRYDRFANRVAVGFAAGGCAEWTWAGGIAVNEAEEYQRIVLAEGTLIRRDGMWLLSRPGGVEPLEVPADDTPSLEELFLDEVRGAASEWRSDVRKAMQAIAIGLGAEQAAREGRRVVIG